MTIIYFNKHGNRKTKDLLASIAKQYPELNFIHIDVLTLLFRANTQNINLLSKLSECMMRKIL